MSFLIIDSKVEQLVITHKDRLLRFGEVEAAVMQHQKIAVILLRTVSSAMRIFSSKSHE